MHNCKLKENDIWSFFLTRHKFYNFGMHLCSASMIFGGMSLPHQHRIFFLIIIRLKKGHL